MKPFVEQVQFYADYHQKKMTLYTHFAGVPLIILSAMIFLGFFHLTIPRFLDYNLAEIGTIILLGYYFRLAWRLALPLTPILIFLLWIANIISRAGPTRFSLWFFAIAFILGWLLVLIGHLIEGKRSAFVVNLLQAFLIAPLYLAAELFFMAGRMPKLKEQLCGSAEKGNKVVVE